MKIFLSYSHNDLDIKRKIKKSFENLKNENLIINIWDDENIRAGDKFDKKIFENLTDSDIAIFLISHNFWKSWYISNIEIPIAIKFNEKYGYPKIVPLIIDKISLNEIYFPELTKFTSIPEKNKNLISFKEFSEENEALEVIKENIKDIIYSGEFPEQREKLDYFIFNKIYGKTKNAALKGVQREKLQDLKYWLKEDSNIAVIEGEEGIGKSILAHQFGNFAWENNCFAIFLSSNIWKNFNSINDLFQYSFGIDIKYEDLDLFNNDYTIFILDGVNERNCIEVSQILIEDFNKTITDFQSKGIKLQIKLLFTTRKLNEYPSYINEIWKNIFKLNLEKYNEKEFNEAIKIYFKDLEIKDFPENIKELAKIPSYFEKTLQLKDRLISIKNLDKTILFWEKLKWQIENDADFKNKIKLTSINDLEYILSKFINKQIKTNKIDKDSIESIFGERFENIKQPLKEGRIVHKESSNIVTINKTLLGISYITYLMAKLKDFLLENKFDLKEVNEEIKRILEPIASDFIAEIPYKTYLFYSKENFENKDDILTALFYNWIENTNTEVTFEKLSLLAYNYLPSFIKLLDLIETKIYLFRFSNLDEIMIKVLKYLWDYKKENFIELKNYLFDENERDTKILKRKIAISSGYKKFEFLKIGAVVVPVSPIYTSEELKYMVEDADVKTIICHDTNFGYVKAVDNQIKFKNIIVTNLVDLLPKWKRVIGFLFDRVPRGKIAKDSHIFDFVEILNKFPPEAPTIEIDPYNDLAYIMYTGGTTGFPKGVPGTHMTEVSYVKDVMEIFKGYIDEGNDRIIMINPLFHIMAKGFLIITGLNFGNTTVLMPIPHVDAVMKEIERYQIRWMLGVPALYRMILENDRLESYNLKSLKYCYCGGDVLPDEIFNRWQEVTGSPIYQVYGSTEVGHLTYSRLDKFPSPKTVGTVLPSRKIKVVNPETLEEVPQGEVGELLVSSPYTVKYYWNKPEETKKSYVNIDGEIYYRMGDYVKLTEDGEIQFVERTADIIKYKGYRISASEIEAVLQDHPTVTGACVIGVPDKRVGERIKAIVVLKEDAKGVDAKELIKWCKQKLAPYKIPHYIEFRDMLPKSKVGKLLRREVREEEKRKVEK